jgi:DNA-binding PadR family transcriptional regulator
MSARNPDLAAATTPDPESFLPVKPAVFHALVALGRGDRHGYALLKEIEQSSGGVVSLLPAALYRHLQRMLVDGLIEESPRRPARANDDERRRYYRITTLGRRVAEGEIRRLEQVLVKAKLELRPAGAR